MASATLTETESFIKALTETLKGKTVKEITCKENSGGRFFTIHFEEGTNLTFAVRHGPGADCGWYNWIEIFCGGRRIELE